MSGPSYQPRDDRRRAKQLAEWFAVAARDLPWRRQRTAYTALVAELMLQQTQVSRVIDRFDTFLERFPTPASLAAADEQQVLACWQGLGYYRRARHLHQAAKAIVIQHAGEVPLDTQTLRQLPGVGRYTAGAIASIVGDQPEPIVDGNVRRVFARWHDEPEPRDAWCWQRAEQLVNATQLPGVVNEAMMELGAMICTPSNPKCGVCPVRDRCRARAEGTVDSVPRPVTGPAKKTIHHHCIVIERSGLVLLEQRAARGLWANMWQPVTIETPVPLAPADVSGQAPFMVTGLLPVSSLSHQTTHRRVEFHIYHARTRIRRGHWQPLGDLESLPMSSPHRRMLTELGR